MRDTMQQVLLTNCHQLIIFTQALTRYLPRQSNTIRVYVADEYSQTPVRVFLEKRILIRQLLDEGVTQLGLQSH